MAEKGMSRLSREIPLKFGVRLIDSASLEEDEDLRETWARLLVNAGDSSTEIDLRTAYIEILAGMSAFDVKNLSEMAKASLSASEKDYLSVIETWNLPHSAKVHDGHSRKYDPIPKELGISLANLSRLGCAAPAYGFDGVAIFPLMTVTHLGRALYLACS